ncbi:HNH endonuclease [Burkholderia thailandensis]|uniref:HNH endonuclease n=2 Tax=Burkholderia humptydooensis TaxID=430531 RepID=UPI0009E56548|nr:HNH endonuclease [Burkholderia thailandensis]
MGDPKRKSRITMEVEHIAGTGVTVISHPDGTSWLVDTDDAPRISWATWKRQSSGYAQCGSGKRPLMHRCVLNYSGPLEVDHINGDRTDNRKANLRLATKTQNAHNRKQHKGLKGVHRRR